MQKDIYFLDLIPTIFEAYAAFIGFKYVILKEWYLIFAGT